MSEAGSSSPLSTGPLPPSPRVDLFAVRTGSASLRVAGRRRQRASERVTGRSVRTAVYMWCYE